MFHQSMSFQHLLGKKFLTYNFDNIKYIRKTKIVLSETIIEEFFTQISEEHKLQKSKVLELHRLALADKDFLSLTYNLERGVFTVKD